MTTVMERPRAARATANASQEYVTLTVANQLCGIPVLTVRDILGPQQVTRVPLAPPEVAGSLNLRGRIVTAIDLRRRLGLPPAEEGARPMSVVVDTMGEFYSLLVDQVGEVLALEDDARSTWARGPESPFDNSTAVAVWLRVSALPVLTGLKPAPLRFS